MSLPIWVCQPFRLDSLDHALTAAQELSLPQDFYGLKEYYEKVMVPNDEHWVENCAPFEMMADQVQSEFEGLGAQEEDQFELID